VEGPDDEGVLEVLLRRTDLHNVQIVSIQGKKRLPLVLEALMQQESFSSVTHLGLVQDADTDAAAGFQSICSSLRKHHLPTPTKAFEIVIGPPVVSIAIIPDTATSGSLEHMIIDSFGHTPLSDCVTSFLNCVKDQTQHRLSAKNEVLAYLATMPDPPNAIGTAAKQSKLNLDHAVFTPLAQWLTRVFR
jgi:hypothetical protein